MRIGSTISVLALALIWIGAAAAFQVGSPEPQEDLQREIVTLRQAPAGALAEAIRPHLARFDLQVHVRPGRGAIEIYGSGDFSEAVRLVRTLDVEPRYIPAAFEAMETEKSADLKKLRILADSIIALEQLRLNIEDNPLIPGPTGSGIN